MRLKELRKERKMLQRQVAEAINCSQAVYSRYENGEREPSKEILAALADLYGVSVDYLLGREESPKEVPWEPIKEKPHPLMLDGGGVKGWPEDRPETRAIIERILAKLSMLDAEGQKIAEEHIDFVLSSQNKE